MQISTPHLGLAAYIKMKGDPLLRVEGKVFFFESARSVQEWRTEYSNTDCMRHDSLVCDLRNFMKQGPQNPSQDHPEARQGHQNR